MVWRRKKRRSFGYTGIIGRLELWALWMGRLDFRDHSVKELSCDTEKANTQLGLRGNREKKC